MGQQGKFLLNKVQYSMPWKFNLISKIDYKNIFFKSMIIVYLCEFFLKKSFYTIYLNRRINFLKKKKSFFEQIIFLKKIPLSLKKMFKQILSSQVSISYYNSWYIIKFYSFTLLKKKKATSNASSESFFRMKYFYLSLSNNVNKF